MTKVSYFNFKALAEPIRMMLSYLGEEFEDHRFEREDWPAIKPTVPFGKVPTLEMDGMNLHQSTAICRWLGKKAGIAGNNDVEALNIDIMIDTLHDFRQQAGSYWYETDEAVKAEKKEKAINETAPYYLSRFDEIVKENNGYLANSSLSWGDIYLVGLWDYLNNILETKIGEKYPNLQKLYDNVTSLPKIKEWIEKRPESMF